MAKHVSLSIWRTTFGDVRLFIIEADILRSQMRQESLRAGLHLASELAPPENLPAAEEPMPTRKHRANRPLCILRLGRRRPVRNQIADEAERSPGLVCSVTVRIRRSTSETEGIVISNETGESSQKGP